MKAGELCVRDVVTATIDEPVIEAARRMASLHVGDVVVIRDEGGVARPVGIVTDRDLVVKLLADRARDLRRTTIADVMRSELVVAFEDDDVETVVAKMRAHAIRRIPIVDARGGLQGVITIDDVIGWMRDQIETTTRALERQGHGLQLLTRSR
jgi:CBS domain-containing protein